MDLVDVVVNILEINRRLKSAGRKLLYHDTLKILHEKGLEFLMGMQS